MLFQYYFIFSAPNLEFPEHYRNIINPVLFTSYRFIIFSFLQISLSFSIFSVFRTNLTPLRLFSSFPSQRVFPVCNRLFACMSHASVESLPIFMLFDNIPNILSSCSYLQKEIWTLVYFHYEPQYFIKKKHYRLILIFWASFVITTLIFHTEKLTLIFLIYLNVFQNITLILLQIFKLSMIRKNLKVIKIHFIPLFCHQNSYLKRRKIELWYFW